MPDFIHERFAHDLASLRSARGNVDLPDMVARWSHDPQWVRHAASSNDDDVMAALRDLGAEAFRTDAGRYATELRSNTDELDAWWPQDEREAFLEAHVKLLFMSALDGVAMARYAEDPNAMTVDMEASEFIEHHRARKTGMLLLGINQGHPGPLIFHPALQLLEIGVIQHTPGVHAPIPLTPDGRVRALPATVVGARHARKLLMEKQCVLVANDYVFEGVPTIRSILFGRPVSISRALVGLALSTNTAVVPATCDRSIDTPERHYCVSFFPDLPVAEMEGITRETVAQAFGLVTEALIRRAPAQWRLWNTLADRWRRAEAVA